jgi:predicted anti-sigma-YlaC factor YlaD
MEHAREIDLIELVAKRLDAEQQEVLQAHLQTCPACRTRFEEIAGTWDILGAWEVHPAGQIDVAGLAVPSKEQEGGPAGSVIRFPGVGTAVRVAAAIAVAVLAGYAGGRWSVRPANAAAETEPPQYVSVLGLDIGASFSPLVLQDGPSAEQEGRS